MKARHLLLLQQTDPSADLVIGVKDQRPLPLPADAAGPHEQGVVGGLVVPTHAQFLPGGLLFRRAQDTWDSVNI